MQVKNGGIISPGWELVLNNKGTKEQKGRPALIPKSETLKR